MPEKKLINVGAAESSRDHLEEEYVNFLQRHLDKFLVEIYDLALVAFNTNTVQASAAQDHNREKPSATFQMNPAPAPRKPPPEESWRKGPRGGEIRDPFAYTTVRTRWYDAVREMAQERSDIVDDRLRLLLEQSDLPLQAFERTREILTQAVDEEWSEWKTKRALSKELITKRGKGEELNTYSNRIRRYARTNATGNWNITQLQDLASAGFEFKQWVTVGDDRVRHTHDDVDGTIVPLSQDFIVGSWPMNHPGDPRAPLEETANCRCAVIGAYALNPNDSVSASATMTENLTAATDEVASGGEMKPKRWTGIIGQEEVLTGDGRLIEKGALRWEDNLPIPLRYVPADVGAHIGAYVVGLIEKVSRTEDGKIAASGIFDVASEYGQEAYRQVKEEFTNGVSMDLDDVSYEIRMAKEIYDEQTALWEEVESEVEDGEELGNFPEPEKAENGDVILFKGSPDDEIHVFTDARIRAATIVAIPAFADARIFISPDSAEDEEEISEEMAEELNALLAAAAPIRPPTAWFLNPNLAGPTPLTISEEGQIQGHLALWDTCHTAHASSGACVRPPKSNQQYAYFRTGSILTAEGDEISVGPITLDTGHAGPALNASRTIAHYDDTGTVAADVAVGEDSHGIWVAGALRSDISEEKIRALRAAPLSGDWRRLSGNLELVAVLAVNSPGFPIPRPAGLVASGHEQSLVAAGMIAPDLALRANLSQFSEDEVDYLKQLAQRGKYEERQQRAQEIKQRFTKLRAKANAKANAEKVKKFAQTQAKISAKSGGK